MRRIASPRGAIAVWVALSAAPMTMLLAVSLDMGQWGLAESELQRGADAAAIAGAMRYAATATGGPKLCTNASHAQACAAASAAADLAEINGAVRAETRSWTDGAKTLADNMVTVSVGPGVKNTADTAVTVTITRPIAAALGYAVKGGQSYNISATAIAELVQGGTSGPQPCITALGGYGTGVTTQIDVAISGNANVTLNGCTMRSNESITLSGNVDLVAQSIYAGSTFTKSGNVNVTANSGIFQDAGQIPDPYAGNAAIQNAFSKLTTQTSKTFSGGGTASPGTYSSMNLTSNTTLNPGLYVVTGNFTVSGNTAVNGSGVTIVTGGSVGFSGNINFNVLAPGTSPTNGAISGILMAGNGTSGVTVSGNSSEAVSGVLYYPNAPISFSGNGAVNGQNTCLEVIAASVTLNGNTNMGGNCKSMGAASFGSVAASSSVQLVQ